MNTTEHCEHLNQCILIIICVIHQSGSVKNVLELMSWYPALPSPLLLSKLITENIALSSSSGRVHCHLESYVVSAFGDYPNTTMYDKAYA